MAIRTYKDECELLGAMERAARRKVKFYFTDFTEHDLPRIMEAEPGSAFVWLLRNTGTWLFQADDASNILAVLECWGPDNQEGYMLHVQRGGTCTMQKINTLSLMEQARRAAAEIAAA